MNEDKKRKTIVGTGVGVGVAGTLAHQAVQRAGGYKAVGSKGVDAAKQGASAAKAGVRQAKDGFTEGAGISAGKVGRKLRDGATIAADKANPGMLRKIGRGAGKGLKKSKKLVGFSAVERRRLINLEAQLDNALDL